MAGRNKTDIPDEILLTTAGLPSSRSPRTGRHQRGERHEILHPKARPPAADADVRISGHAVCPVDRHRAQAPVGMLEGDSILSPELLRDDERERLAPEGMKWVRDQNLRRISGTGCS